MILWHHPGSSLWAPPSPPLLDPRPSPWFLYSKSRGSARMGIRPRRCARISSCTMDVLLYTNTFSTAIVGTSGRQETKAVRCLPQYPHTDYPPAPAPFSPPLPPGAAPAPRYLGEQDAAEGVGDGRVDSHHVELQQAVLLPHHVHAERLHGPRAASHQNRPRGPAAAAALTHLLEAPRVPRVVVAGVVAGEIGGVDLREAQPVRERGARREPPRSPPPYARCGRRTRPAPRAPASRPCSAWPPSPPEAGGPGPPRRGRAAPPHTRWRRHSHALSRDPARLPRNRHVRVPLLPPSSAARRAGHYVRAGRRQERPRRVGRL